MLENGKMTTVPGPRKDDLLAPVFENGKILRELTFDEVRANSERELFWARSPSASGRRLYA